MREFQVGGMSLTTQDLSGNMSARWTHIAQCLRPVLFALLACGVLGASPAYAQKSTLDSVKERGILRAGIRFDDPPHGFVTQEGSWVGFDVDIAEALAKDLGVKLEKVRVDELTRISYLQIGQIDIAVASLSHTRKRDEQIDFSQTYFWSKQTVVVKRAEINRLAELAGKRVGITRGSSAGGNWRHWLTRNGFAFDPSLVLVFGSKRAGLEAVRQGAIAAYAEDYEILLELARSDPSLAILDEPIGPKLDGVGVRENDSKMRDAINFALQYIAKSGEYTKIYNRWFGPKSDTPVPPLGEIEVWPDE
jgi:polar amino acid transport system substrate-binding protein